MQFVHDCVGRSRTRGCAHSSWSLFPFRASPLKKPEERGRTDAGIGDRPRIAEPRLGGDRRGWQPFVACRQRHLPFLWRRHGRAPHVPACPAYRNPSALCARNGGGGTDLCQQGRRGHAQAWAGAGHRPACAGAIRVGGGGIRAQHRQENRCRRGARHQGPDCPHGPCSASRYHACGRRCRRCSGHCDLSRPSRPCARPGPEGGGMIGRIAGRIDYRASDHVLIDVRGVGYLVYCSDRTLQSLPRVGEHTALYTDLVVREDLLQLFGFPTLIEKEWHRLLMSVQGVGAKASLAILGALGPDGVGRAIALGDWNAVKAAQGIGPKTAQRVVNELKDKLPELMAMGTTPTAPAPAPPSDAEDAVIEPASLAVAPPPPRSDARAVAQAAEADPQAETAAMIRAALRLLAPKG